MMYHKVLDKKEKSSNSVIFPESWFQHFTELFRKKNLNMTLFLNIHIYPYPTNKTFSSVVYSVHGVITVPEDHPGPN